MLFCKAKGFVISAKNCTFKASLSPPNDSAFQLRGVKLRQIFLGVVY